MTLAFSTQIANNPTYFPEKILSSLVFNYPDYDWQEFERMIDLLPQYYECTLGDFNLKQHTIREDSKNKWKQGNKIHFVINNRTKKRFQFAPVFKCVSIQEIKIEEKIMTTYDCAKLNSGRVFTVQIDNKYLSYYRISELAINDGFDSVEAFFEYFNKDFKGKIIHWTDLKY